MKNCIPLIPKLFFGFALLASSAQAAIEVYTLSTPNGNAVNFQFNGNTVRLAIGGVDPVTVCRQNGLWLNKYSGFIIGPFTPAVDMPNFARRIGGTTSLHSDGTFRIFNSISDQPTLINPFGGDVRGNIFVYHLDFSLNDLLNTAAGVPSPTQFQSSETRIQINSIYAVRPDDVTTTGGANTANIVWQLTKIDEVDTAPTICQSGLARSATPITTPPVSLPDNTSTPPTTSGTTVDSGNTTTPATGNGADTPAPAPQASNDGGGAMAWTLFLILCLFGRRAVTIVRE